jgi:Immunoglobulin domain
MTKLNNWKPLLFAFAAMIAVSIFYQNCAEDIQLDQYATTSPSSTPNPGPSPAPSGVPVITNAPTQMSLTYQSPMQITIQASGAGLTYSWFKNNMQIASQSSATYNIASVQDSDAGTYRVEVSNSSGMASATILVSVTRLPNQTPPTIVTQLRNVSATIPAPFTWMGKDLPHTIKSPLLW